MCSYYFSFNLPQVHRLEEEKLELRKQMFKLGTPSRRTRYVHVECGVCYDGEGTDCLSALVTL